MSTWQARVKAPCEYTVLLSGENQARPMPEETGLLNGNNLACNYTEICSASNASTQNLLCGISLTPIFYSILQIFYNGIIMLLCRCLPRRLP